MSGAWVGPELGVGATLVSGAGDWSNPLRQRAPDLQPLFFEGQASEASSRLGERPVDGDGSLIRKSQGLGGQDRVTRLLLEQRAGRVTQLTRTEHRHLQLARDDGADVSGTSGSEALGSGTSSSRLEPDEKGRGPILAARRRRPRARRAPVW